MSIVGQNWTKLHKLSKYGGESLKLDLEKRNDIGTRRTLRIFADSMTALLCRKSFEELTIRDICNESMIPRSTFYNYFEDKYDLLDWYLGAVFEDILRENSGYSFDALVNGTALSFRYLDDHAAVLSAVFRKNTEEGFLYRSLEIHFFESMKQTFIDCDHRENLRYPPELTAQFCAAVLWSLFETKLRTLGTAAAMTIKEAEQFLADAINYRALGMVYMQTD